MKISDAGNVRPYEYEAINRRADLIEDIASREEDATQIERELREIERELPKMQMRQLELQRDLAISRLAILKLEHKLAEVTHA